MYSKKKRKKKHIDFVINPPDIYSEDHNLVLMYPNTNYRQIGIFGYLLSPNYYQFKVKVR